MSDQRIRTIIEGRSEQYRASLRGALHSTREFSQEQRKAAVSSRVLAHETRVLNRALEQQSRRLAVLTLQWQSFRYALMTVALRTAVAGMAAFAATAAAAAGGLAELTQQAGLLGAGLGVLGVSGFAMLGQGILTMTLGLKGVGKALATTGRAHELALEKLTPEARKFVGVIGDIRDAFRIAQLTTQKGLFPGLTRAAENLKVLGKPLQDNIYHTAQAIGYLAERFSVVLAGRKDDIGSLMHRNTVSIRRFGDAGINVFRGLVDVMRAADPFIGHVTRQMVTFTEKIADLAREARADGTLRRFFEDVRETWDRWLRIAGNLGGTLFNVLKAAAGPAQTMAKSIEKVTQKWQDWTGDSTGQAKMTRFFGMSNRVLGSMARFTGAIFESFVNLSLAGGDNAVKFFDMLRLQVLPVIEDLGLMLNAGAFPAMIEFVGALGDAARAALPGLQPFADVVRVLTSALTDFLKTVTPFIGGQTGGMKLVAAFAIGAGILFGWGKLRLAIQLVVLELRRAMGLTAELNVLRPGAAMMRQRGGRADGVAMVSGGSETRGASIFALPGQRPGGTPHKGRALQSPGGFWWTVDENGRKVPVKPGTRDARSLTSPRAQRVAAIRNNLLWQDGITRDRAAGAGIIATGSKGRFRNPDGTFRKNVGGRIITPYGQRSSSTGGFVKETGNVNRQGVGPRTAAYRAATNIQPPDMSRPVRAFNTSIKSVGDGLGNAARKAAPLAKGGAIIVGLTAVMSALTGPRRGLGDRAMDAGSVATLGVIPSSAELKDNRAKDEFKRLQGRLRGGQLNPLTPDTRPYIGDPKRKIQSPFKKDASFNEELANIKRSGKLTDEAKAKLTQYLNAWKRTASRVGGYSKDLADNIEYGLTRLNKVGPRIDAGLTAVQKSAGKNLSRIRSEVNATVGVINSELGRGTDAARAQLARNFRMAAAAVRQSMEDGKISTKTGMAQIRKYLIDALVELNPAWNRKQAGRYLHDRDPLTNKPMSAGTGDSKVALERGGLRRLPGPSTGPDKLPLKILAAPGEDVAVFNRHQRKRADKELAHMGGLPGLFRNVTTAHNKPEGYATGGMVTGDTDFRPALKQRLERMADATDTPIFVQEGGRTIAEQAARYRNYLAGGNLAAKPSKNAPHVMGVAADITPGRERFGAIAAKYGLSFPVSSEGWHIQLAGAVQEMADRMVKSVSLKKPTAQAKGMIGAISQKAIDRAHGAASARLQTLGQSIAASQGDGGASPIIAGAAATVSRKELAKYNKVYPAHSLGGSKGKTRLSSSVVQSIAEMVGLPAVMFDLIAKGESSRYPGIISDDGGHGLWQMTPRVWGKQGLTKMRSLGGLTAMRNPIQNGRMAKWLYEHAASKTPNTPGFPWYGTKFLNAEEGYFATPQAAAFAAVNKPPSTGGAPKVNPKDAVQPKPGKDKKGAKPKKPFAQVKPLPGLATLRKQQKRGARKVPDWIRRLQRAVVQQDAGTWIDSILPDTVGLEGEATKLTAIYNARSQAFDAKAAPWRESQFIVRDADGNEVRVDQPAIDSRSADIRNLLGQLTGNQDGKLPALGEELLTSFGLPGKDRAGGIAGNTLQRLAQESIGISRMKSMKSHVLEQMTELRKGWTGAHELHERLKGRMAAMTKKNPTWQDAVENNEGSIEELTRYLEGLRADPGHRQPEQNKKNAASARERIRQLRKDNSKLKTKKPRTTGMRAEQKRLFDGYAAERGYYGRVLDVIGGNRERLGNDQGVYGGWWSRNDQINTRMPQWKSSYTDLWTGYQGHITDAGGLISELGELTRTKLTSTTANDGGRAGMLEGLLQESLSRERASVAIGDTLRGFAPMLGQRLVGAFKHGGPVTANGLALVERGEYISPERDGPFHNQAGGNVNVTAGDSTFVFSGELGGLMQLIDARVRAVAPGAVGADLGRRQRVMRISPGR